MMSILRVNILAGVALLALALTPGLSRADDTPMTLCKDGTTAAHAGRGACSGHGGIDKAASQAASSAHASSQAATAAGAAGGSAPMAATGGTGGGVLCRDGSMAAQGGRGACSGHGGIDRSALTRSPDSEPQAVAGTSRSSATQGAPGGAMADRQPPSGAMASSRHSTTRLAAAPRSSAAPGGGPGQVWANSDSKVYHCPGDRWYGRTMQGGYMTEAAARSQGYRPDHNKPCE